MSMAWETTPEDLKRVLERNDIELSQDEIEDIFFVNIDDDRIEKAVLYYTDFDDQVEAALDEIEKILIEDGIIREVDFHGQD
jgi:hypothetical protein